MRRPAIGGALYKTVFPVKYRSAVQVPTQRTASAIAAHCISHRSALHPALAAHCTRHTGHLPYSPHPLYRDCTTSLPPPATKFPYHYRLPLRSTYHTSSPSLSHCPIVPTTLILPHKTLPHHHPPASDSQSGIVALHTHHSSPLYPQRQPAFSIPHHGPPQPTKNPPLTP